MSSAAQPAQLSDVLLFDENVRYSREAVTLLDGETVDIGTVLGRYAASAASAADAGNTGDGTMGTVTPGSDVEVGDYSIELTGTGPGVAAAGTGAADATAHSGGGNTGNGTITASPATGANAQVGTYRLICIGVDTNLGEFEVVAPDGTVLGTALVATEFSVGAHITFTIADGGTDFDEGDAFTVVVAAADSGTFSVTTPAGIRLDDGYVAVAYSNSHLAFTLADGSTDFAVGDIFLITVAASIIKYAQFDDTATNGIEKAAGVALAVLAPSGADGSLVALLRHAVVKQSGLKWPATASAGEKATAIAELEARGILVRADA